MTLASSLFGSGGNAPYIPGKIYDFTLIKSVGTTASVVNEDRIFPFIPRRNATLDKVCWYRDNTTAGNAYVGIYSLAGVLLTDCAVDANTTIGWHAVNTTNVALLSSSAYYLCINVSVDIAATMSAGSPMIGGNLIAGAIDPVFQNDVGFSVDLDAGANLIASKSRTNAALLSTLTMSGFSGAVSMGQMGVMFA